jgi:hypothetical protein
MRLADNRTTIADLESAKLAMREIALITKACAVTKARAEKRIAEIKTQAESQIEGRLLAMEQLIKDLSAYITANPPLFQKPRTVKTDFGEFGLRTVTDLLVPNEAPLIEWVMERGYLDCFETVHKLIKPAITKRLKAKEVIPGAQLREGDTVVCKVSAQLISHALEEAIE